MNADFESNKEKLQINYKFTFFWHFCMHFWENFFIKYVNKIHDKNIFIINSDLILYNLQYNSNLYNNFV